MSRSGAKLKKESWKLPLPSPGDADFPLLEARGLSFTYQGGTTPVFEHLGLTVLEHELLLIKGVSGCGKSTLLRLFCRLNTPDSGTIHFRGREIRELSPSLYRSRVCLVAQVPLMTDGSVRENLLLPFTFASNSSRQLPSDDRLSRMLDSFFLGDLTLEQPASRLSVGQKQRLAIMRSLLADPELLLLDEPTSSLDRESALLVFSIIERLNAQEGKTVLLVTHSDYTPSIPGYRSLTLRNGKLIES